MRAFKVRDKAGGLQQPLGNCCFATCFVFSFQPRGTLPPFDGLYLNCVHSALSFPSLQNKQNPNRQTHLRTSEEFYWIRWKKVHLSLNPISYRGQPNDPVGYIWLTVCSLWFYEVDCYCTTEAPFVTFTVNKRNAAGRGPPSLKPVSYSHQPDRKHKSRPRRQHHLQQLEFKDIPLLDTEKIPLSHHEWLSLNLIF